MKQQILATHGHLSSPFRRTRLPPAKMAQFRGLDDAAKAALSATS